MNLIGLRQAVREIRKACDAEEESGDKPFFFIVGAGISVPSIPLAREIVLDLQTTASASSQHGQPLAGPLGEYAHWFRAAHPHAIDRQRYLHKLIKDKPITHANLRLAHLLLDGRVANLVVTPNFDDFLTRSLDLLGHPHIVCDHPRTAERVDPERGDVQVVHVHGTYSFYDCCNLKCEIDDRAEDSRDEYTMSALLRQLFQRRSPLVIGYSGWETDVIMGALLQRLKSGTRLPRRLYWFCYSPDEATRLPALLQKRGRSVDSDVCFVVKDRDNGDDDATVGPVGAAGPDREDGGSLEAKTVFEALITGLGIGYPLLVDDPLEFFAQRLERSFPSGDKEDIYSVARSVHVLKQASQLYKAAQLRKEQENKAAAALDRAQKALASSRYAEAAKELTSFSSSWQNLPEGSLPELLGVVLSVRSGLSDSHEDKLALCDLALRLLEDGEPDGASTTTRNEALLAKANALAAQKRHAEALQICEELAATLPIGDALLVRRAWASLIFQQALGASRAGKPDIALEGYQALAKRFNDDTDSVLQAQVARALCNAGVVLRKLERREEAIDVYRSVIDKFPEVSEGALRHQVARAHDGIGFVRLLEGKLQRQQGRTELATETFQAALASIKASLVLDRDYSFAHGNLGYVHFLLDELSEAKNALARAFALGGEKMREAELRDAALYPLPEDEKFKALVMSLPVDGSATPTPTG